MDAKCHVVPSQKGSNKLELNGFLYLKSKTHATKKGQDHHHWFCDRSYHETKIDGKRKKIRFCFATVVTVYQNQEHHLVSKFPEHTHESKPVASQIAHVRDTIKELAMGTSDKPCKIIQSVKVTVTPTKHHLLPSDAALTSVIKRCRKGGKNTEPTDVKQLNIPDLLKVTHDGMEFLVSECPVGDGKILLFVTRDNIRRLCDSKYWMMDGTFRVVSKPFYQLYTIFGLAGLESNEMSFPLVFFLSTGKSEYIYSVMFETLISHIKKCGFMIKTKYVITDFERAPLKSLQKFIEVEGCGCYFHFKKVIRKNLGDELQSKVDSQPLINTRINQLYALSFLPPQMIPAAYIKLKPKLEMIEGTKSFLNYFEKTWIGYEKTGVNDSMIFHQPLFKPNLWSVNQRTVLGYPRTQNSLEAWNGRINRIVDRAHVGLFELIRNLKDEEYVVRGRIIALESGKILNVKDVNDAEQRLVRVLKNPMKDLFAYLECITQAVNDLRNYK